MTGLGLPSLELGGRAHPAECRPPRGSVLEQPVEHAGDIGLELSDHVFGNEFPRRVAQIVGERDETDDAHAHAVRTRVLVRMDDDLVAEGNDVILERLRDPVEVIQERWRGRVLTSIEVSTESRVSLHVVAVLLQEQPPNKERGAVDGSLRVMRESVVPHPDPILRVSKLVKLSRTSGRLLRRQRDPSRDAFALPIIPVKVGQSEPERRNRAAQVLDPVLEGQPIVHLRVRRERLAEEILNALLESTDRSWELGARLRQNAVSVLRRQPSSKRRQIFAAAHITNRMVNEWRRYGRPTRTTAGHLRFSLRHGPVTIGGLDERRVGRRQVALVERLASLRANGVEVAG